VGNEGLPNREKDDERLRLVEAALGGPTQHFADAEGLPISSSNIIQTQLTGMYSSWPQHKWSFMPVTRFFWQLAVCQQP
jgi:hypothetical protein